ncbi:hypothetical protein N657DRAFT_684571 [Parathielavia appendiculata]|uniref:Meiotic recombination protein DMC1 n=1 Tax=Parathielavia appendiculata TaxID=2587402 RepID=A0AAN6TR88_9PEZI|nr:hypothetical protein N657DRAFT_684571 [Parathielavia appendiculata]
MAETPNSLGPGGFMPPSMPSPAPSTSTVRSVAGLPHPRAHALRPGSAKEDQVRHFVASRMEHITRRFVKKQGNAPPGSEDVQGYKTMAELCKDLEGVIDIIWLSGTPSLQVPFLLNIASEFNTWVTGFPASPTATFAILRKLDHCFASLLSGEDVETHEPLPGFENGPRAGMSRTDMVRCRSLVEQGRIVIVDVMSKAVDEEEGVQDDGNEEQEDESGHNGPRRAGKGFWDDEEEDLYMDVARVYENTLVKLGDALGDPGLEEVQMSAD